jgi:hypothetical protein
VDPQNRRTYSIKDWITKASPGLRPIRFTYRGTRPRPSSKSPPSPPFPEIPPPPPFGKGGQGNFQRGRGEDFVWVIAKLNSIGAMPIFPASRRVHCAVLALTPCQPFNRVRASKPSFLKPGRWTEFEGKSNERYETRHFVYLVPGESPAIELYIAANRNGDPPDGMFEVGLVKCVYLSPPAVADIHRHPSDRRRPTEYRNIPPDP